jgi:flavin reductase (DIM6/NTAB) family NADH-FMN oxidoreductase RutF
MKKKAYPLGKVYGLLETGPVVLLTTQRGDRPNVMTLSWHMMMEFAPPLVGCVLGNRNFSFEILRETKECVINIPTLELAEKVVACGNSSGRKIDKFKVFGLTQATASCVKVPFARNRGITPFYVNGNCFVAFDNDTFDGGRRLRQFQ